MPPPLKVLIAEDNPADAELLLRALRRGGFEPEWRRVDNEAEFIAALHPGLDLVLSDYSMPQFTGFRALELLRMHHPEVPFLIVSGTIGEDTAVEAMRLGATDYLLKDRLGRLGSAVSRALEEGRLRKERQQAVAALRVSEERYRTTIENIMEGCQLIGFDWRYLYLNNAAAGHNRRPNAELLGRKMTEAWPGIEASPVFALLKRSLEERRALHEEIEFVFIDGSKGWFDVRSQPVPEGIFVLSIDITERKRAEAALRQSERSLLLAQRVAQLGNWDLDLANLADVNVNPLRWSDELFRLFGYEPGSVEVSNGLFFRHVHPEDRRKVELAVAETLRTGRTYSIDHRINLPDGSERVIHEQADLIRDEHGRPLRMVGTAQDVTERWRAEESLRQSEERFRQMIANGSDIIELVDARGVIRFQSPSTERILGHDPRQMIGARVEEYIHPDDVAKVAASIERVLAGREKPIPVEYRCRHRDGSWRTLQSFGKMMPGAAGGENLIVVNSRDVTESRSLEEQLRQSQKMEAIGQLSGGVAHDFNNLLTVIKGHIGLLRAKGQVSPEIAGGIQQIDDAANRAANLTRQLLTFSRQQVMQSADLNLTGIVMNLARMLRRLLSENIEMEVTGADQPLPIRADEGMVEQVLLNLVVNARDAMPRGGRLQVSTAQVDFDETAAHPARPGAFAALVVSDTGTGIPPDVLPRIFEPFFTTKGIGKGTGLGLATVYGVMQQHGGWVTVHSTVGQGTTFGAYFPRLKISLPATIAGPGAMSLPGGHEGILLVEDEGTVREIAQAALTGLGYRVFAATSGLDALQTWEIHRHEIELLLTDLVMPEGITGRDLAVRLRDSEPRLPVVYMSGYSYEVAGNDFSLEEDVNYLPKPFDLASLARIVRSSLDRGAAPPPARPPSS